MYHGTGCWCIEKIDELSVYSKQQHAACTTHVLRLVNTHTMTVDAILAAKTAIPNDLQQPAMVAACAVQIVDDMQLNTLTRHLCIAGIEICQDIQRDCNLSREASTARAAPAGSNRIRAYCSCQMQWA